jgi:cytochrome c-type biogenesis protein CcsB
VTPDSAALLSNTLVYGAMACWALAVVALAGEVAFGGRSGVARTLARDAAAAAAVPGTVAVRTHVGDPPTARGDRLGGIGTSLLWLGTGLLGAALVLRGVASGRAPWANMYEFAIAGAFVAALAFLGFSRRFDLRPLAVWVTAVLLLTLGLAVAVLYVPAGPVVPALRSTWLVVHVLAAVVAAAVFTVGMVASALQIVAERAARRGVTDGRVLSRLPAPEVLDRTAYRLVAFGFPIWTFAVVAGAIWAQAAWGRYWGWDPKEVWALVTWLVYAAYLHARATAGWRGSRASWIAIAGYVTLLFDFFGVNIFFVGLHSYGGL